METLTFTQIVLHVHSVRVKKGVVSDGDPPLYNSGQTQSMYRFVLCTGFTVHSETCAHNTRYLDWELIPSGQLFHEFGGKVDISLLPNAGPGQQLIQGKAIRKTVVGSVGQVTVSGGTLTSKQPPHKRHWNHSHAVFYKGDFKQFQWKWGFATMTDPHTPDYDSSVIMSTSITYLIIWQTSLSLPRKT